MSYMETYGYIVGFYIMSVKLILQWQLPVLYNVLFALNHITVVKNLLAVYFNIILYASIVSLKYHICIMFLLKYISYMLCFIEVPSICIISHQVDMCIKFVGAITVTS